MRLLGTLYLQYYEGVSVLVVEGLVLLHECIGFLSLRDAGLAVYMSALGCMSLLDFGAPLVNIAWNAFFILFISWRYCSMQYYGGSGSLRWNFRFRW